MGGSGGGQQSTNTIQNSDPWKGVQPGLAFMLQEMGNVYTGSKTGGYDIWNAYNKRGNGGGTSGDGIAGSSQLTPNFTGIDSSAGKLKYYGGDLVADITNDQASAFSMARNAALSGGASRANLRGSGEGLLGATVRGDYLDPSSNPWASKGYDLAWEKVAPTLDTSASKYGAYGSSDYSNLKAKTAEDLATQYYGNLYQIERQNQMSALGMVPEWQKAYQDMDYADADALIAVGDAEQKQQQAEINAAKSKYDWEQMEPYTRLALLKDIMGGAYGGGSSNSTTTATAAAMNPAVSTIGGGLAGAASGAAIGAKIGSGYPGYGTAIGAVVGALGGFLGSR